MTASTWQRQIGLGYGVYRESAMRLRGPDVELGLRWHPRTNQRYELEWMGARQRYDSDDSGFKSGVPYYESRLKGLYDWPAGPVRGLSVGWLLHYGYSDLRGATSTQHQGYERVSQQIWLPLRWQLQTVWWDTRQSHALEVGWLLYGQQTSRLSQASTLYDDARNTQRTGLYLQWRVRPSDDGPLAAWEPSVRLTRIGNSDTVSAGSGHVVTEPASWTLRLGLSRGW